MMVDQIYYKVQYPLKKAIDLMKALDKHELSFLREDLNSYEKEKIVNFIENWNNGSKEKLNSLISDLKAQQ
jgi:Mg/Co/Ni transporter MgtE